MRQVVRYILVLTVSFALITSAAAWRQCTGLQLAASAESNGHSAHSAAYLPADAEHDHHALHVQDSAGDPGPATAGDHGCMKCCAMCTVTTALLSESAAPVIFIVTAHVYSRDHKSWSGNAVAVDPGIPKRIV